MATNGKEGIVLLNFGWSSLSLKLTCIMLFVYMCRTSPKVTCIDALGLLVCDFLSSFVSLAYMQWWKQTLHLTCSRVHLLLLFVIFYFLRGFCRIFLLNIIWYSLIALSMQKQTCMTIITVIWLICDTSSIANVNLPFDMELVV